MEVTMMLCLLWYALGSTQGQIAPDAPPDIEVINLSWSYERAAVFDDTPRDRTAPVNQRQSLPREAENINAVERRISTMRDLEDGVHRDSRGETATGRYKYRIELKNRGSKVIKLIFLDYQISTPSDPENPAHHLFACPAKINPDQRKKLETFSNSPPRRIINASDVKTRLDERLIINRIEYSDGSFWQRSGYYPPERLPSIGTSQGSCRPL